MVQLKICRVCKEEKAANLFTRKNRPDGSTCFLTMCLQCEKARSRRKARRNREMFWEYKRGCKCILCGESDPVVIEFHHIDPRQKVATISRLMSGGFSPKKVKQELAKCVPMCANCHRRVTYQEILSRKKSLRLEEGHIESRHGEGSQNPSVGEGHRCDGFESYAASVPSRTVCEGHQ